MADKQTYRLTIGVDADTVRALHHWYRIGADLGEIHLQYGVDLTDVLSDLAAEAERVVSSNP